MTTLWVELLTGLHEAPAWGRWLSVVLACGVLAALAGAVTRVPALGRIGPLLPATMMPTLGALFALFSSFLASDVFEREERAHQAMHEEALALSRIVGLADSLPDREAAVVRGAVTIYLDQLLRDEWTAMQAADYGGRTQAALDALRGGIADLQGVDGAVKAALLGAADAVADRRGYRLYVALTYITPEKWLAVGALGALTLLVIALCTVAQPRVQALGLTLFALAMGIAMALIIEYDQPFSGSTALDPWMFEMLSGRLRGGS